MRICRKASKSEQGVALITVMLLMTMLMTLAISVTSYAIGAQDLSHHDERWNAAIPAAEAGVDDYLVRLNQNSNYWTYSATNPPPDGNQAFSQFVNVPGDPNQSSFEYSADSSQLSTVGTIKVTSTGNVGGVKRTIQTTLRRRAFLDYLYFTNYETVDPAMYTGNPFTPAQAQTACAKYYYAGRDSNCSDISFITGDSINGPMHSNDAILLCGSPHFNGATSSSWSGTGTPVKRWRDGCPTSTPVFANTGDPSLQSVLTMPPSDSALRSQTNTGTGGCLYTGPTRIVLNSNGTMTVKSPYSVQTNNSCVTNGTGALPTNGIIYVQNVPTSHSDPNYRSACSTHPLSLPISNDVTTYKCSSGDVFIEGTLKGQLTIASENNIDITWNLQYKNGTSGSDLLGLIANNYVEVYHPVSCTSGTSSSCNLNANFPNETARGAKFQDPTIQAAILSLQHSFRVQNWAIGSPVGSGTTCTSSSTDPCINLTGAFAQQYRGPVGTFSSGSIVSGYLKNYVYDQRLKYLEPPQFLDPVGSSWAIATWAEVQNP